MAKAAFFELCLASFLLVSCFSTSFCREDVSNLCSRCTQHKEGVVVQNCTGKMKVNGSCCVNDKGRIVGLDMSNCSISDATKLKFTSLPELETLLLDHNPFTTPPQHLQFKGLKALNFLSLPKGFECPGGASSWKSVHNTTQVVCREQINNCVDVNCPTDTSKCTSDGPGFSKCICENGWTGYKCLRKEGKFPLVIVLSSLAGSALITIFFIWCINKRGRKNAERFRYQAWTPDEQEDLIHT